MRLEEKITVTAAWLGIFVIAGLIVFAVYGLGLFIASRAPLV